MLETENAEAVLLVEDRAEPVVPEAVVEELSAPIVKSNAETVAVQITPLAHQALLARVSDVSLLPPALKERVEQAIAQTAKGKYSPANEALQLQESR